LNSYKDADHSDLAAVLNENPESFWLLTYDKKRQIKSLYSNYRIINFSLNYRAYEARVGKEILILADSVKI